MKAKLTVYLLFLQAGLLFSQAPIDSSKYSNWRVTDLKANTNGVLSWKSINEPDTASITIQQFRWNKWVKVGQIKGKGEAANEYEFRITTHSGENEFRVGYSELNLYCESVRIRPQPEGLQFRPTRAKDSIWFTEICNYEIHDAYGRRVMKGRAKNIHIKMLKKGVYYINYGREMGKFIKK